jgi:hypothetical protein
MLGGVLYRMDDFSMSLFTHPDILKCNRNGVIGQLVQREGKIDVWKTPENGNEKNGWVGIFNRDTKPVTVDKGLKDLGLDLDRNYVLKDLWTQNKLPISGKQRFEIPADGVVFLRYKQAENEVRKP